MSQLHLVRIPVDLPGLLRFAAEQGITQDDPYLGYTLHAWFAALFGPFAPKPFRFIERRNEVLAYSAQDAQSLLDHARSFSLPQAWDALDTVGVLSKPMPNQWRTGQLLHLESLVCPVTRQDGTEKDVYLRTLERMGQDAPARPDVYRDWFLRQWGDVVQFEEIVIQGMITQSRLLRRSRNGHNRLRFIERPQVTLAANVQISNSVRFMEILIRGIGRHRAFGFGMVLLSPPQ